MSVTRVAGLALAVTILIAGACGGDGEKSPTATNSAVTPAATTQTPAAQTTSAGGQTPTSAASTSPAAGAQPIAKGDFELTMNGVTDPYVPSDDAYSAEEGYRWVLVDLSLKNISQEPLDYGADFFYIIDAGDFEYSSSSAAQDQEFDAGTIAPGETVRGQIAFDMPVEVAPTRLVFDPDFDPTTTIEIDLP
jgi:hypothetical protein